MDMSGDMGGMGGMDMDMSCNMQMTWNWNIMNTCPVSEQWHIKSHGAFAGSVIGTFFIVVAIESVRRFGREYDRKIVNDYRLSQNSPIAPEMDLKSDSNGPVLIGSGRLRPFRPTLVQQIIRALIYFVQFSATYIVMLIAMTFNGYLLFAIFFGGAFGYLISSWDTVGLVEENDKTSSGCCC